MKTNAIKNWSNLERFLKSAFTLLFQSKKEERGNSNMQNRQPLSIEQILTNEGFKFLTAEPVENQYSYVTGFDIQNAHYDCWIEQLIEERLVFVHAHFNNKVSLERRNDVAIFIAMLNYNFPIARFEIDMFDGDLRVCINYHTHELADVFRQQLLKYMENCVMIANHYYPAFMNLIYSNRSPKEVYCELENRVDASLN